MRFLIGVVVGITISTIGFAEFAKLVDQGVIQFKSALQQHVKLQVD
jgi:hypothetical protein